MRSMAIVSFCAAALVLLLGVVGTRPYPDGPFSVQMMVDGRSIPAGSEFHLSSYTDVVEYRTTGVYTKSPGETHWEGFYVDAPQSRDLDNWFAAGGEKSIYLRVLDGRGYVIEAWLMYRIVPLTREPLSGGEVRYTFGVNSMFARDTDIVPV